MKAVHYAVCNDCLIAVGPLSKDNAAIKVMEHMDATGYHSTRKTCHYIQLFTFRPHDPKFKFADDWHWTEDDING